ncbi:MAG: hypothetical protein AAFN70_05660, partial [Planctomycetota bacterium]
MRQPIALLIVIERSIKEQDTGYQSVASIRSELLWTEKLAQSGFACPSPLRTLSGELVGQAGDQIASMVSWIAA